MSSELALQDALLTHLKTDASLGSLLGTPPRVFETAPRGAVYPFLSLGRGESEPVGADGADLIDHRLTLHVWGRRDDLSAVKAAIGALRQSLHQANLYLTTPYTCPLCRVVYADMFAGADGRTLHGVLRVRALIEKGTQV